MQRLTPAEISALQATLADWQTPEAMQRVVDESMNRLGSPNLFNQGGLAFLRDAWIAAQFSKIRNAEKVRLVNDTWPDFELILDDQVECFEATEADDPNRRRGEEYKNGTGVVEDDPVEAWEARAEQAAIWIQVACQKKLDKHYSARANLVVYLNLNEYGIRQNEIESSFPSATKATRDAFDAVWVLWKSKAYRVWPQEPN